MHNCYNGVLSWFYQALGGIRVLAPGCAHLVIDPQIPAGLEWVKVSMQTPYGTVTVQRKDRKLQVELPVGVTATIGGREYDSGSWRIAI